MLVELGFWPLIDWSIDWSTSEGAVTLEWRRLGNPSSVSAHGSHQFRFNELLIMWCHNNGVNHPDWQLIGCYQVQIQPLLKLLMLIFYISWKITYLTYSCSSLHQYVGIDLSPAPFLALQWIWTCASFVTLELFSQKKTKSWRWYRKFSFMSVFNSVLPWLVPGIIKDDWLCVCEDPQS